MHCYALLCIAMHYCTLLCTYLIAICYNARLVMVLPLLQASLSKEREIAQLVQKNSAGCRHLRRNHLACEPTTAPSHVFHCYLVEWDLDVFSSLPDGTLKLASVTSLRKMLSHQCGILMACSVTCLELNLLRWWVLNVPSGTLCT